MGWVGFTFNLGRVWFKAVLGLLEIVGLSDEDESMFKWHASQDATDNFALHVSSGLKTVARLGPLTYIYIYIYVSS